jgi:hypothetical protein
MVTGHNADWAGFSVDSEQDIDNDTAYGDTAVSKIGNGLPEISVTANGFLKAGAASSAPGHGAITAAAARPRSPTTRAAPSQRHLHRPADFDRQRPAHPASPVQIRLEGDGALTETWAVS